MRERRNRTVWCPNHGELGQKESLHDEGFRSAAKLHGKLVENGDFGGVLQCQCDNFENTAYEKEKKR